MRPGLQLSLGIWAMTASVVMAASVSFEPTMSLADVAERYTEYELHAIPGSVHAVAIDRRVLLGCCPSAFEFKYPFGTKTTLEVMCPDTPTQHRYVTMTLPSGDAMISKSIASNGNSEPSTPAPTAPVWVASHDLAYGTVLGKDDLVLGKDNPKKPQGIPNLADLVGYTLTRPLTTGSVVARPDIRATQIVKRQMPVMAYSSFDGGQVTSKMVALQDGAVGDFIEVQNPQSGRKRYGQIQSDGTIRLGGPEIQKNLVAGAKVAP